MPDHLGSFEAPFFCRLMRVADDDCIAEVSDKLSARRFYHLQEIFTFIVEVVLAMKLRRPVADGDLRQAHILHKKTEGSAPIWTQCTVRIFGCQNVLIEVKDSEVELLDVDSAPRPEDDILRQRSLPEVPCTRYPGFKIVDKRHYGRKLVELVLVRHVPAIA